MDLNLRMNPLKPMLTSFQRGLLALALAASAPLAGAAPLDHITSWVCNSFPGANDKRVQNFFIQTHRTFPAPENSRRPLWNRGWKVQ